MTNLTLEAASEGAWGMQVRARVDKKAGHRSQLARRRTRLGVQPADLFDLTLRDGGTGAIETFLNLTTKDSARRADRAAQGRIESGTRRRERDSAIRHRPTAHTGALTDADVWTNAKIDAGQECRGRR